MTPGLSPAAPRIGPLAGVVALFSVFVNLLMLTGPLFMLQIHDRVLASRSEATLVSLFALVAVLFAFMGLIDHARARIAARAGARFQAAADGPVLRAALRSGSETAPADVVAVRQALSSPAVLAVFDLPWAPIFLVVIFLLHPALGWLAVCGLAALVALMLAPPLMGRRRAATARSEAMAADAIGGRALAARDDVRALGLEAGLAGRWQGRRMAAVAGELSLADLVGGFQSAGRAFRFFMQSAMLALGAFLAIRGEVSPGAMVAASILLGRALAPVDQAVTGWPLLDRGLAGWRATGRLLASAGAGHPRTALPRPTPEVAVEGLYVVPPGASRAALIGVVFAVEPGEALGVIGPSGAGKSCLARALTGVWTPQAGRIRLGGATLDQYAPEARARSIGYLPQDVALFPGTVADNIARFADPADAAEVVRAAKAAGAHEMILRLEKGYDTVIDASGGGVSGGQRQRIALARALFGRPELLVLDEPNSNLDAEGQWALTEAIRVQKAEGRAVIIMAHRPAAIARCDRLMILEGGRVRAIGPRDEILRADIRNHTQVAPLLVQGGRN